MLILKIIKLNLIYSEFELNKISIFLLFISRIPEFIGPSFIFLPSINLTPGLGENLSNCVGISVDLF